MTFPETHHTFIQRLASQGKEDDWRRFMDDYWFPVCRFATRSGRLKPDEAEDVASITFAGVIQNNLLSRWVNNPSAKLRTLLCSVVRNVLSNRARIESGRASLRKKDRRLLQEAASVRFEDVIDVAPEDLAEFYAAWVDELLHNAVNRLLDDYHKSARGDCFRVLYGRICEQMTNKEIAQHLRLKLSTVENYFKDARDRLGVQLRTELRRRVEQYSRPGDFESEFQAEWSQLSKFLRDRGGIENAIRSAHEQLSSGNVARQKHLSITTILTRVSNQSLPDRPPG
jgi:RNA polymerase sigma factor (sigma-70 family)